LITVIPVLPRPPEVSGESPHPTITLMCVARLYNYTPRVVFLLRQFWTPKSSIRFVISRIKGVKAESFCENEMLLK
jgi:hypothetical protein